MSDIQTGLFARAQEFAPYPDAELLDAFEVGDRGVVMGVYQPKHGDGEVVVRLPADFLTTPTPPYDTLNKIELIKAGSQRAWGQGVAEYRQADILRDNLRLADFASDAKTALPQMPYESPRAMANFLLDLDPDRPVGQQVAEDFRAIGQAVKQNAPVTAGAFKDVVVGLYGEGKEVIKHMDPPVRRAAAVLLVSGSVIVAGLSGGDPNHEIPNRPAVAEQAMLSQKRVSFTFSASQPRKPIGIARELGMSKETLENLNPEIDLTKNVLGGQSIEVVTLATTIHLVEPLPLKAVAKKYTLSQDALRAVNTLQKRDGKLVLVGDITLPGRMTVPIDGEPNIEKVSAHVDASPQVVSKLNEQADPGTMILPLGEMPLSRQQIQKASESVLPENETSTTVAETTTTITTDATTTTQPEQTATTITPETTTSEVTTTTAAPVETTTTTIPAPSPAEVYGNAQAGVLNEIASGEGGWDSFNHGRSGDAHGKYVLKDGRRISQLTIAEVLKLQHQHKLFAVGRYQFIPATLRSAIEATGIDTSRQFDAAAQNELAIKYLLLTKRPALADYLHGKSDDVEAAAQAAAQEWASLPYHFRNGSYHSYYSGRGGNHAKGGQARYQHFEELLTNFRAAYIVANQDNKPGE